MSLHLNRWPRPKSVQVAHSSIRMTEVTLDPQVFQALTDYQAKNNCSSPSEALQKLLLASQKAEAKLSRETLSPPGVHTPQARYSHVSRVGNLLFLAGQVPLDVSGNIVGKGDAEAQATQCFNNILNIVKHFGGDKKNIVKTTTYLTNWGWRSPVSAARDRFFSDPYPANTLVVITSLASPDMLVEVEAIASLDACS
mmetsp:Transcript_19269/g.31542  ORF Transcript_19269/g.31542 Transcript_19269/m.31542 type:complete len:197 (-) Transcript_19269:917-1507(-)